MLLLDTHALIWWLLDDRRLGRMAATRLDGSRPDDIATSAVSWYEVHHLQDRGRLRLKGSAKAVRRGFLRDGLTEIQLDGEIALDAATLGNISRDPMDRLIVATARCRGATLVTADERILGWGGDLDRMDARD